MRTKKLNRRYFLHRKLKKGNVRYQPKNKIISVRFDYNNENNHITELRENYNYSVQTEIE